MKVAVDPLEALESLPLEPREPLPVDQAAGDDPGEALIKEAKQRARRRRFAYGGVVVVGALVALGVFATFASSTSPPQPAVRPASPPPTPLGAPLVVGPDASSTLLASWSRIHTGYVFVYADGRVIWYPDNGVVVDAAGTVTGIPTEPTWVGSGQTMVAPVWMNTAGFDRDVPVGQLGFAVIERRLSARGLDLLRAGRLAPQDVVVPNLAQITPEVRRTVDPSRWPLPVSSYQRDELWAEPTATIYEPAEYAVCLSPPATLSETHYGPLASVPPEIQVVLAGKEHVYDPNIGTAHWSYDNPDVPSSTAGDRKPLPLMSCFALTAAEASTLYRILDSDFSINHGTPTHNAAWIGSAGAPIQATPIYPHAQPVMFGG